MAKKPKKEPQLSWKRGVRDKTEISNRMTWRSRCGRYYVQESIPFLTGLPKVFYAVHVASTTIIGRLRVKHRAEQACEQYIAIWAKKEAIRRRLETINLKKKVKR